MQKKTAIILVIIGILLLLIGYVSNAQQRPDISATVVRPNILWIVCEDMSPHLGCFGEKIIETPNLDALAKDGVKYTNVYTCAGVCAPSRNGIITGMQPISIGGDNMRNYQPGKDADVATASRPLPSYSIVPPSYVKCFPEFLRKEMYYCTNNSKEDYQFEAPVTVWDESSNKAHWRNRPEGKPFFAVFNLNVTHESQVWQRDNIALDVDTSKVIVPPYYPDVAEVRHDIARNLSNIIEMDKQAGKIIQQLKEDGLYDNTIIFFYSDHGDGLPFVKREVLKRGLHIPMIIKFPGNNHAGKTDDQLISGIDFAPTVLSLAGIPVPAYMQGQPFLGVQKKPERKYLFAARDRMDEHVDRVRTIFDGRFQYLKNYMQDKPYYQHIAYRLQQPSMRKIIEMRDKGQLNKIQMLWFKKTKPVEELYDTEKDPYEFNNLAADPAYKKELERLRMAYNAVYLSMDDKNAITEKELVSQMWNGNAVAPETGIPALIKVRDGYIIQCATPGASIGYLLEPKNGTSKMGAAWKVYHYGSIALKEGDKIIIQAQRIGFKPTKIEFIKTDNN